MRVIIVVSTRHKHGYKHNVCDGKNSNQTCFAIKLKFSLHLTCGTTSTTTDYTAHRVIRYRPDELIKRWRPLAYFRPRPPRSGHIGKRSARVDQIQGGGLGLYNPS